MKNVNKGNDRRRRKTVQTRNVSAAEKSDEDEEQKRHHAAQIGDGQLSDVGEKSDVRLGINVDVHLMFAFDPNPGVERRNQGKKK